VDVRRRSKTGRRRYIGQNDARSQVDVRESLCDRAIALQATDERLDEHGHGVAPHEQLAVGTRPGMDGDHFLVLFADRAVIEADRYAIVMDVGPALDPTMVGNIERQTLRRMGGRARGTLSRQIAHSPAHTNSNTAAIPSVVRNGAIPALLD
jgi:hypothetical protein